MTEKQKEYYSRNREKIIERQKAYNQKHKAEKREYDKKRSLKRWKEKGEYNEKYYQEHREEISAYYKKYYRRRRDNKMDLDVWKKERDEVVKTYNLEKFREFYEKWSKKGLYNIELPPDPVLEIALRKMVLQMESATDQEKEDAKWWLSRRGIRCE